MSKPFYWMGALALITLLLYSCQKDELSDNLPTTTTENPITPETPTTNTPVLISDGQTINDGTPQGLIGVEEIKGSIKAKALVKDIIQETFMQLVLNHDLNPLMPPSQRETCACDGLDQCGCPMQVDVTDPADPNPNLKTIRLSYKDATTCLACTPASTASPSGFTIFGDIDVTISDALVANNGHIITIVPADNFTVDNHDFDATKIELESVFPAGSNIIGYKFNALDNVAVTDPNGNTTTLVGIDMDLFSGGSLLQITDVGNNHGSLTLGFGLLDDIYELFLVDAEIVCSNGQHVIESTTGGNPLVFDMACECIERGVVEMYQTELDADGNYVPVLDSNGDRVILSSTDYGYEASTGASTGGCDDKIQVTTCGPGTLVDPNGNSAVIRTGGGATTVIDCL